MNAPAVKRCASRVSVAAMFAVAVAVLPAAASATPAKPAPVKWETYAGAGFAITLPEGYAANPSFTYEALGPGKEIHGTSFTIPERIWTGSNLSSDTYLSVEQLPGAGPCTAARFLSDGAKVHAVTDRGVAYSVGTFGDAGAGNFYDQTVYALAGSKPCTAVRYFIHSTNIGNYDPGTVQAFSQPGLVAQFDKIRRSLKLTP